MRGAQLLFLFLDYACSIILRQSSVAEVFKSASSEQGEIHYAFFGSLELCLKHASKTTLMTHCWIRRRTLWRIGRKAVSDILSMSLYSYLLCPVPPVQASFAAKQHELCRGLWLNGITRLGYPAVPPALLAFPSKAPRFARPRPNKQCIIRSAQQGSIQFTQTTCLFEGETLLPQVRPTCQDRNDQDSLAKGQKTWISWHWSPHQTTTRNWEVLKKR